jgi:hypothetical protein
MAAQLIPTVGVHIYSLGAGPPPTHKAQAYAHSPRAPNTQLHSNMFDHSFYSKKSYVLL